MKKHPMMTKPINVNHSEDRPKRYGWAPGQYIGRCHGAGCKDKSHSDAMFIGDKRATMCADCAYALPWPPPPKPAPPSAPLTRAEFSIGKWLSAALEDPKSCDELKRDIKAWFDERGIV